MSAIISLYDGFKRKHQYLRLSITDVCNFKCNYCLPNGYSHDHLQGNSLDTENCTPNKFLTPTEIKNLIQAFVTLGTTKVRITGGEPTLRKDFLQIVKSIKSFPQIQQIALSTNGYRMLSQVESWREAGITSINLSLDSMDPRTFQRITGMDKFQSVILGIDKALAVGFKKIKVNTVLLKNLNYSEFGKFVEWIKDKPIQLRFIELMQTGNMSNFFRDHHVAGQVLANQLQDQGWHLQQRSPLDGPAQIFSHPDYQGEIGFILPYSQNFCADCNRLRVSARGELHLCLFGEEGINLRDLLQDPMQLTSLQNRIMEAVSHKRAGHLLEEGNSGVRQHLASIGG